MIRKLALWLVFVPGAFAAPPDDRDQIEVRTTFERCIGALRNLETGNFARCFDDDITLFNPDIPDAKSLHLLKGRREVESHFGAMFESVRKNAPAPRLDIAPRDVLVQVNGATAIVTFEFDRDGGSYGRRTMVLIRRADGWKILHIHASNIPGPRAAP
jgi:ketosteroid isomerase-like protein